MDNKEAVKRLLLLLGRYKKTIKGDINRLSLPSGLPIRRIRLRTSGISPAVMPGKLLWI